MNTELNTGNTLPCPFCGCSATTMHAFSEPRMMCSNSLCLAIGPKTGGMQRAEDAWSHRHPNIQVITQSASCAVRDPIEISAGRLLKQLRSLGPVEENEFREWFQTKCQDFLDIIITEMT